jgi:enoyl-[acyl-carrier protein] reductase II
MWTRGKAFLGTRHAILGGAMTWVSEPRLVSAISGAGGFGVLACGSMTPPLLEKSIAETADLTPFPFGVNLITMHPDMDALVDVCLASSRVQHVFLAGGLPSREIIRRVTSGGRQAVCFAPTAGVARRLVRDGAGALVIEGSEAGGHIGPVSTSILAQEILPVIRDVPVFVAGGIGRGEAMAQYLMMGASGCQLGTRFVCATESRAHPRFKAAFIRAHARDAVASVQLDPRFPVIPVRAISNRASEEFLEHQRQILEAWSQEKMTAPEAQLAIEHYWAGALRRAVVDGDTEKGSLMAGQSVGMVTAEEPVQTIMDSLVRQALDHIARVDAA